MSESPPNPEPVRIRKRHVFYLPGYDPRGVGTYRALFEREYAAFCSGHGVDGRLTEPEAVEGVSATGWCVQTAFPTGVETRYEFLRWEDLIRGEFLRPAWWKVVWGWVTVMRWGGQGVWKALGREMPRFLAFLLFPYGVFLVFLVLAAVAAGAGWTVVRAGGGPGALAGAAALGLGAGVFSLLIAVTAKSTYVMYLLSFHIATDRWGRGWSPAWEARFAEFARHVVDTVRTTDADEVLVVGHSLGAAVAVDVLDRALTMEPGLLRAGPRIALCTLGGTVPLVSFLPAASWFRKKIRRVAGESGLEWGDFQCRQDVINAFPLSGTGLEAGKSTGSPWVVNLRLRDLVSPGVHARLRRKFFDVHFQFLKTGAVPGAPYDYFSLCCGPIPFGPTAARGLTCGAPSDRLLSGANGGAPGGSDQPL